MKLFRHCVAIISACLLSSPIIHGSDLIPFPNPLSLSQALAMIDENHPTMLSQKLLRAEIETEIMRIDSEFGLEANLNFELRTADKTISPEVDFIDDSRTILTLDKPLTQFGQETALRSEYHRRNDSLDQLAIDAQSSMRFQVIQAFLGVLAADIGYLAADEEMTLRYLEFDDVEGEFELDEITEIEVLEKQARYLDALGQREAISNQRTENRLRLALALNRVDSVPDILIEPDLSGYDRKVPEYRETIAKILDLNPRINAARLQLESKQMEMAILKNRPRPMLGVRLQVADYAQNISSSRDKYRASVYLDVPLTRDRHKQVKISELHQDIWEDQAEVANLEHQLRRSTLQLIQRLNQLDIQRRAAQAELLYREYDLDKIRLQYEMEVRARIGLANTMVAKALTRIAQTNYERVLTWEKLDALTASEPITFQ